jgi:hypothetical protein
MAHVESSTLQRVFRFIGRIHLAYRNRGEAAGCAYAVSLVRQFPHLAPTLYAFMPTARAQTIQDAVAREHAAILARREARQAAAAAQAAQEKQAHLAAEQARLAALAHELETARQGQTAIPYLAGLDPADRNRLGTEEERRAAIAFREEQRALPHLSMAGLKARGWTDALIRTFLGESDETADNPYFRSAAPMRLYRLARVEACEQTPAWIAAHEKTRQRQVRAHAVAQRKRDATFAAVEALTIHVQQMDHEALIHAACQHYNWHQEDVEDGWAARGRDDDRLYVKRASPDDTPAFLERITVNYLRHQGTAYEDELERLYGTVGADAARMRVKERVLEAIAAHYPHLASECERQRVRMRVEMPMRP